FYGPFFLALAALLGTGLRLGLTDLVLFLGAAAFGLKANRNGIWFALLSAPILCRALAAWISRWPGLAKRPAPAAHPALNLAIAGFLLGFTVLLSPWVYPHVKRTGRPDLLAAGTP